MAESKQAEANHHQHTKGELCFPLTRLGLRSAQYALRISRMPGKTARIAADTRKFVCPFINLGTPIHEQQKTRTLALVKD